MRFPLEPLDKEKFSAIVTGIMLPGLDGYSFITTLRWDSRFKDVCARHQSSRTRKIAIKRRLPALTIIWSSLFSLIR